MLDFLVRVSRRVGREVDSDATDHLRHVGEPTKAITVALPCEHGNAEQVTTNASYRAKPTRWLSVRPDQSKPGETNHHEGAVFPLIA